MQIDHVVIQWPRLGPYHLARLRAAQRLFSREGVRLTALETASDDDTYAWREETGDEPFERVQAFPGRTFESVSPAEMQRRVKEVLTRLDPDAVAIHTYSFPDSRACLEWCRRNRRIAVLMTDSKADDAPRTWIREVLKSIIISGYDAGLVAGSLHRDYMTSLGLPAEVLHVGYDVVDNDYFSSHAAAAREHPEKWRHLPGLRSDEPFFLSSNRFIERKNLLRLLDAYEIYRRDRSHPWRLVLLGDGPLRQRLEDRIERTGIEGVTLVGFRQIDEIPAYYAAARALVHPALVDQWALVVNEGMATGLPVLVSSGSGCHADLVEHGVNGFVFDPGRTDEIAASLARMDSPDVDPVGMGEQSLRIISDWTPDRFAASVLAAVRSGRDRSRRPLGWKLRVVLAVLRWSARNVTSFHTIEA